MAKTKAELLEEAKALGIEVDAKAKVAEIQALINNKQMTDDAPSPSDADDSEDTAEAVAEEATETEAPKVAKAGKRSAKALEEAEAKAAKEERKEHAADEEEKPKGPVAITRSRLERRSKGFRKSAENLEADKQYKLEEAIALAKKTSHVKFDATVEMHIRLGVNPRHADQNIRDNLVLPAGTGKTIRIAVLTEDIATAKAAGADIIGTDAVFAELDKGTLNFDILISTPQLMAKLGKYARTLGPRGLMPNPKSGTVTTDIDKAIAEAKAGRVEYRVDTTGIVHLGVGKVSFSEAQLLKNVQAVIASIKANKPQSVKGTYFRAAHLTTSMGPSISLELADIS
ncbi:MAG: Ribosomal protein [Candidatus Saccharibacteria bacterium]|nr:Ribosomal protein [Candidatus Saccharibacteria bacterium]